MLTSTDIFMLWKNSFCKYTEIWSYNYKTLYLKYKYVIMLVYNFS